MTLPSLRLKANAERRLRAGHLWVYSNEVDVAATPLNAFAAGDQAVLEMANGKPLGIVALSPNNLICGRLISRDTKHVLDKSLLVHRINIALSLRERLFDKPFYRLVYGDSDLLPGLVVDRFGDVLVVQLASAAMELRKDEVLAALLQVLKPAAVLWKNDSSARDAEGLERYVANAYGEVPEWVALEENGVKFEAPVLAGQKTGWFYDHRMNRARLAPYVRGKRVLDLFCGLGNFSLPLARRVARVVGVEGVAAMVERAGANALANGLGNAHFFQADLSKALAEAPWAEQGFTAVLLDPPRDGAFEAVREMSSLGARRVVYVSCNPATLARDAGEMARQGYRLKRAGILDMFPQTAHVEAMALFEAG